MGFFDDFFEDTADFFTEDIPAAVRDPFAPENLPVTLGLGLGAFTGGFAPLAGGLLFENLQSGRSGGTFGSFVSPQDLDVPVPTQPGPGASQQEINAFNQAIEDFQLLQQGLRKEAAPDGGFFIREIPDAELIEAVGQRGGERLLQTREITRLSRQRLKSALAGELPLPKAFERESEKRKEQTRVSLARGPGEFSTAGIQKFGQLQESEAIIEDAIRRGEITAGQAINLQQQQTTAGIQSQILQSFQTGRFGAADIGLRQQDLETQLRIAELFGGFGREAGRQELFGSVIEAGIPAATRIALRG